MPFRFLTGSTHADELIGTDQSELVFGFAGDDSVRANAGSDTIFSGLGNDLVDGGAGNDRIFAGLGNDRITGGLGADYIDGGLGFDTVSFQGSILNFEINIQNGLFLSTAFVTSVGVPGELIETDTLINIEALRFEADSYTVYLDGRNNAALARDDAVVGEEDAQLTLAVADLLANDADFDGDIIALSSIDKMSKKGAVIDLQSGVITYSPATLFDALKTGETATDTFAYTIDDEHGGLSSATVTVSITGANDAPELSIAEHYDFTENNEDPVFTATATDAEDDPITFSLVGKDSELLTVDAVTGEVRFKVAPDFETPSDANRDNTYDVTLVATDLNGASNEKSVEVTVTDIVETPWVQARINEVHYDNSGTDTGEFVEIRVAAGTDTSGLEVLLVNGNNGSVYNTEFVSNLSGSTDEALNYYVWELPANGIQNGAPDGIALLDNGTVLEFLSYAGTFTSAELDGTERASADIGVSETSSTAAGQSLQRNEDGTWNGPTGNTKGAANKDDGGTSEPTPHLISEVQGSGDASLLTGEYVQVSAVVTYTTENGFFLQEEDADADDDARTSEGIFVFTGGTPDVEAGDLVNVAGTVEEYFGFTRLGGTLGITRLGTTALPTQADIQLSHMATDFEQYEGMRISVTSGIEGERLTIVENFNFDRFGDIAISAGNQIQPTQLFDAQNEATDVAALAEANQNNRLSITDGVSSQNTDTYRYIVNTSDGDDGDGILGNGDVFSETGPTLRLGSKLDAPVEGILSFEFGEYKALIEGTLSIDEKTNSGARLETPEPVGGSIQVASFNVLNYFTTFSGGTGPGGTLSPRGADTQAELDRQTAKLVDAITETGGDVIALQEIENNGFGSGSAIATLVAALNAKAQAEGTGADYAFVNPLETGEPGYVGTDAIMTGIIYDTTKMRLVHADMLVFNEASAAATFQIADALNPFVETSDQLGDFQRNRPATVATFEEIDSGETFTLASIHFKSKGDSNLQDLAESIRTALDEGKIPADQEAAVNAALTALLVDPNFDQANGQAYWNQARLDASRELITWLEGSYADALAAIGVDDADYLLMGDFNAYAEEDAVQAVRDDAGYIDLIDVFVGQQNAYSFVFDGQRGTLDQALASDSLANQVTGLTEWHINADEPDLLNYDQSFTDPGFYSADVFASSDHDPVVVGLTLETAEDAVIA
ncbi:VCBS repeat-containing protein [Roseibium hamelinense]|uniref:VCBS repeat-containing protein n=1 Tax=Roseibium hamelinense TaxID=150831 RepID=A0A562SXJ6_9HYPH|nr:ExeM/NucH family extracellular endonuclease [Roseibium hamelinense]MTI44749.1 ExeM/NucH family extracellular endonuclease [Roseibium hamelinense]TWI86065.1 VCBS repeat-containing protein [Roseibium hamelinense]